MSQNDYLSTNIWKDETWQIESDKTKEKLKKQGYDSTIKTLRLQIQTDRMLQSRSLVNQEL